MNLRFLFILMERDLMSIKKEYLDIEIDSNVNIHGDNSSEIQDKKAEVVNPTITESEPVIEDRPIFQCTNCDLIERYDNFGDRVPFNRNMRTKTDFYLTRDPFSPRNKKQFLILGSVCSVCDKDVCVRSECSIFYYKFFCSICARKNVSHFPSCIQKKIKAAYRI